MKQYYSLITIIISVIIIIVGYFAFKHVIAPSHIANPEQEKGLVPDSTYVLSSTDSQQNIYSIELELSGEFDENISFVISDNDSFPVHNVQLKKGKIDFTYMNDWYEDSCFVRVINDNNGKGNLKISYRFLGLN